MADPPRPTSPSDDPLRVGLVGAGPWAQVVHAPLFAAGPDTTLAGVWSRRPEAAEEVAARHGARSYTSFAGLLAASDAVVFAVPPEVQPEAAARAAHAGKPLLLEKPIAATVAQADRLTATIERTGVGSLVAFTYRFLDATQWFVEAAQAGEYFGARASFFTGALLPGNDFATDWRVETGPVLDTGPHLVELLDAALGPVVDVYADRDPRWVTLTLHHARGATSTVSLCSESPVPDLRIDVELFGPAGVLRLDLAMEMGQEYSRRLLEPEGDPTRVPALVEMRRRFVAVARGAKDPLDARRGAEIQHLIAEAQAQLDPRQSR